jgi:hypothetical protein
MGGSGFVAGRNHNPQASNLHRRVRNTTSEPLSSGMAVCGE